MARARQQAIEQQPEPKAQTPPDSIMGYVQARNFAKALDLIEATLQQRPTDRETTVWLARLIEGPTVPLKQRLRAAHLAAQVGDPRAGVCTLEPAWCPVPGGRYLIGTQLDPFNDIRLTPQWVRLKPFRIARYPVTVRQFRQFWEDPSGYSEKRWWIPAGWAWKQENAIKHPHHWGEAARMAPNQPVAGVTWYEAAAFCAWLTQHRRETAWLRVTEVIRLPTEAEWEVAAMWDARAGSMRPWRPQEDELWQNVREAGIGHPSPVGIFPHGMSPSSALDMAGNVWEWCSSHFDDYPKEAARSRDDAAHHHRGPALRGGAYNIQNSISGWHSRNWYFPNLGHSFLGFRVVLVTRGLMG